MRPGKERVREVHKVLARSRQLLNRREEPEKYTSIHKLISNFETAYFKVTGYQIHIEYRKGYYYFDHIKWNHSRLERELIKLLLQEQQLIQEGDTKCPL